MVLGLSKKNKKAASSETEEPKNSQENAREDGKNGDDSPAPSEGSPTESADASQPKKRKKLLLIVLAAVVVVVLGGGAGAAYYLGFFGSKDDKENQKMSGPGLEDDGKPVYFDMPQILVNLNTGGKQASFIKTTVTLELGNSIDVPVVQANLPRLMDDYNTFLREMRASDLYGSAGVYRLREEMLVRANKVLAPVKVKDVLFREILVQ